MRTRWITAAVLAVSLTGLIGCGQVLKEASARDEAVAVATGGFGLMGVSPEKPGRALISKLSLTPEQQNQMKALALRYRGDAAPTMKAHRAEAKALMLAPTVDTAAITAFLKARGADFDAKQPGRLALASELRGVLTAPQRESLAGLIEAAPPRTEELFTSLREKVRARATSALGLTKPQGAALDALVAKVDALRNDARKEAVRTAAAGFVRTGDAQPLARATAHLSDAFPIAEAAALVASLDQKQRQLIVQRAEWVMARRGH